MSDESASPDRRTGGLIDLLRQGPEKPEVSQVEFGPELRETMKKLFYANRHSGKRQMWLFGDAPRRFHEALGDKGFANMLENCEITTDTTGYEYIEQFNQRYED